MSLHRLVAAAAVALPCIATLCACLTLGRVWNYWLLAAVAAVTGLWFQQRQPQTEARLTVHPLHLALLLVVTFGVNALMQPLTAADGRLSAINLDHGYFAQVAAGLPEAGVASHWAGALGAATRAAGETQDVWYHWGPVFLTSALSRLTGLSTLITQVRMVTPLLDCLLVLMAAGLVARITGWAAGRCLLVGGLSLLALPYPGMTHAAELMRLLPTQLAPQILVTLTTQFS